MSRDQTEVDLTRHLSEKTERAIGDAWDLLETDEARARAAVVAATVAVSFAAAALHDAKEKLKGPVPSERDFFFAVLKLIGDAVPATLGEARRG